MNTAKLIGQSSSNEGGMSYEVLIVTADELLELCADESRQIVRFSKEPDGRYKVETVQLNKPDQEARLPYADY